MAKNDMDFASEFPEDAADIGTTPPVEAEKDDANKAFILQDGSKGSRAAFIREKFLNDNMSRKEISEMFDLSYRVVYSATVNMTNSAEASSRGRSAANSTIQVTENDEYVLIKDDETFVNGEKLAEDQVLGELHEVSRNQWIRDQVAAGGGRGDIAKLLDMSYGVVYGITKDLEGSRARIEVSLPDGTKVSRAEYIRMQFAAGETRGDIAKQLDVPYSVVWQATKTEKTVADHFAEAVDHIKEFADKVTDEDLFGQICVALDTIQIKEEADPKKQKEEAAEAEADADAEPATEAE